jgi:hypothetical protein
MSNSIQLIVILCGDRNWTDPAPIARLIDTFPPEHATVVITGGARGADSYAWELARKAGHRNIRLDAPWEAYGTRAGPVRNQWMLDLLLGLRTTATLPLTHVHAFHDNIASSKGTADMLSRARHANIPTTIHSSRDDGPDTIP